MYSLHLKKILFQKDFQLYYDTQPMFENAETAWTSWDDKLDSDVLTKIVDEQQKLAQELPHQMNLLKPVILLLNKEF